MTGPGPPRARTYAPTAASAPRTPPPSLPPAARAPHRRSTASRERSPVTLADTALSSAVGAPPPPQPDASSVTASKTSRVARVAAMRPAQQAARRCPRDRSERRMSENEGTPEAEGEAIARVASTPERRIPGGRRARLLSVRASAPREEGSPPPIEPTPPPESALRRVRPPSTAERRATRTRAPSGPSPSRQIASAPVLSRYASFDRCSASRSA